MHFDWWCRLLEVDAVAARKWLCHRSVVTAKEKFVKPLTENEVSDDYRTHEHTTTLQYIRSSISSRRK